MYLTAQRVLAPDGKRQAINSFFYLHHCEWRPSQAASFRPESNPGTLVDDAIELSPPGNRVRSYLDVVAPDGTSPAALAHSFEKLVTGGGPLKFPLEMSVGRVWFRFDTERTIRPAWRHELRTLFRHALAVASPHLAAAGAGGVSKGTDD